MSNWRWQRRDKKLKSKKNKMLKHNRNMNQLYIDIVNKRIKDLEDYGKIAKEIDEFAVVASNEKIPKYNYGKPAIENTSSFMPEMKEMNYSGQKKKILDSISKLHESKIDEIEDEAEEKEPKTELQEKILGPVENFEKKMIQNFINEYEKMAILSKEYSNDDLGKLFILAKWVNHHKSFNLSAPQEINRLEQVLYVDNVAHQLHKMKDSRGKSAYKQLDDLADISKSIGESDRFDRLLLLQSVQNAKKIEDYMHVDILQKGNLLEKSKSLWRLFEKCIKFGPEKLSNKELILLREFLFSKI